MRMRALLTTAAAIALTVPAGHAGAKVPGMTFHLRRDASVPGQEVVLEIRTWEWGPDGEPDTSRPWRFWPDRSLNLPMEFRAGDRRIPVPTLRRIGPAIFRTTVRFPSQGTWQLSWTGSPWTPPGTGSHLPSIRVIPKAASEAPAGPASGTAAGAAAMAMLLGAFAVLERRRSRRADG